MDAKQIFVKTLIGDEAVRQSTRVVQRNLRMVLVQVDGKLSVAELSAKIGNPRLVEAALRDLEEGGFIASRQGLVLGRVEDNPPEQVAQPSETSQPFPASQFSSFGKSEAAGPVSLAANSQFSSFGKPILPTAGYSTPPTVSIKKPERKLRREPSPEPGQPLAIGRWLFGVSLGLLLLSLLLALLYPYNNFKPAIEAAGSQLLQAPVKVGAVGISFWPRPALTLSEVKLGDAEEGTIELVRVTSPFALLGSRPSKLSAVDVVGAKVSADFLVGIALFKKPAVASASGLRIDRINLERFTVTARDLALRNFSGQIAFLADGSVEKAALRNDDEGIRLEAVPAELGIMLDIQGSGWMPLGKALAFNSLQAKGVLQQGKLVIQSVDTTFLNGILKGSWFLDWSKSGLAMAGDATLQRLDCRKMTAALVPSLNLEGELSGNLRLRASGQDWNSLWNSTEAHLDADIMRGILHGTDLGEAVRGGSGFVARAGSTKFDRLRVALNIDARQVFGRDVQMTAGMMSVSGQFVATRQHPVDASLLVTMKTSVSTVRAPVHVTGELSNLQAISSK
jgi:hypothetical protein